MVPSVLVILAQGFEEVEAITPIDLLRRSGAHVTVAGLDALMVKGSHGLEIGCDALLADCRKASYDCVVLPGGGQGSQNLAASFEVLEMAIKTAQSGVVAAICAAPAIVLGKTGLLDGKKVTGYPGTEQHCPGLHLRKDKVIIDGNLITAQAAGSAMRFALAIIATLFDESTAEKIADQVKYEE
ncbi:MAG: DJ-1 family glyoxalase III [Sphaerochaeta sp.]|jgi:4-methyl-5(b-hydroxyethyl)-thiazole monophosphate biosynthesis|uniref:DJ-1 family glyoxalase III n=1 Tax=Sphaerochaeta sp. TaxID=1972642 RepID=UPI002FC67921